MAWKRVSAAQVQSPVGSTKDTNVPPARDFVLLWKAERCFCISQNRRCLVMSDFADEQSRLGATKYNSTFLPSSHLITCSTSERIVCIRKKLQILEQCNDNTPIVGDKSNKSTTNKIISTKKKRSVRKNLSNTTKCASPDQWLELAKLL